MDKEAGRMADEKKQEDMEMADEEEMTMKKPRNGRNTRLKKQTKHTFVLLMAQETKLANLLTES